MLINVRPFHFIHPVYARKIISGGWVGICVLLRGENGISFIRKLRRLNIHSDKMKIKIIMTSIIIIKPSAACRARLHRVAPVLGVATASEDCDDRGRRGLRGNAVGCAATHTADDCQSGTTAPRVRNCLYVTYAASRAGRSRARRRHPFFACVFKK